MSGARPTLIARRNLYRERDTDRLCRQQSKKPREKREKDKKNTHREAPLKLPGVRRGFCGIFLNQPEGQRKRQHRFVHPSDGLAILRVCSTASLRYGCTPRSVGFCSFSASQAASPSRPGFWYASGSWPATVNCYGAWPRRRICASS